MMGNDMEEPFHAASGEVDLGGAMFSGGVQVAAAIIPVPPTNAPLPALIFTFATPDGSMYPPMVLVMNEDQVSKIGALVTSAAAAALAHLPV